MNRELTAALREVKQSRSNLSEAMVAHRQSITTLAEIMERPTALPPTAEEELREVKRKERRALFLAWDPSDGDGIQQVIAEDPV